MKVYLTTDTHFGHDAIIEYCGRPQDHEKRILNGWKNLKESHILIHLGDICWYDNKGIHEKYIAPLKCKKILIKGNHDKKSYAWYMNHGWDFACDSFTMRSHGLHIIFSHKPLSWDGYFDVNIHGHLHNTRHHEDKLLGIQQHGCYGLSIEIEDYKLVPLDKILSWAKTVTNNPEGKGR